jgi:hypothetical protein
MERHSKKEIKEQYKNRKLIGGIYSIKCNGNGRIWFKSTNDLEGQINKFNFFVSTNFCPEPTMRVDWNQYGAQAFSFTVIEKLEKSETQTEKEFTDDIHALHEMWINESGR